MRSSHTSQTSSHIGGTSTACHRLFGCSSQGKHFTHSRLYALCSRFLRIASSFCAKWRKRRARSRSLRCCSVRWRQHEILVLRGAGRPPPGHPESRPEHATLKRNRSMQFIAHIAEKCVSTFHDAALRPTELERHSCHQEFYSNRGVIPGSASRLTVRLRGRPGLDPEMSRQVVTPRLFLLRLY